MRSAAHSSRLCVPWRIFCWRGWGDFRRSPPSSMPCCLTKTLEKLFKIINFDTNNRLERVRFRISLTHSCRLHLCSREVQKNRELNSETVLLQVLLATIFLRTVTKPRRVDLALLPIQGHYSLTSKHQIQEPLMVTKHNYNVVDSINTKRMISISLFL